MQSFSQHLNPWSPVQQDILSARLPQKGQGLRFFHYALASTSVALKGTWHCRLKKWVSPSDMTHRLYTWYNNDSTCTTIINSLLNLFECLYVSNIWRGALLKMPKQYTTCREGFACIKKCAKRYFLIYFWRVHNHTIKSL